jgi:glycosyltransferase involved in cell wall biosynthesis
MTTTSTPPPRATVPHSPRADSARASRPRVKVCVVGAGPRFLSGISYYTNRLINVLGQRFDVSAVLIRQMMPARWYPGRTRVGKPLAAFTYPPGTRVYDGIDWFWLPSMLRAIRLLRQERPQVLILQWWTGTVLHSYLLLALIARVLRIACVIEFHEVQDPGESLIPVAAWYVRRVAPVLMRLARGFVVHNEYDRQALLEHYRMARRPVTLVPHGPYDQYGRPDADPASPSPSQDGEVCRLLYFGVIRPFKGVEDIVSALELMTPKEVARFELTGVGETWENWTLPGERIAASPYRDRIRFINRYVHDEEVGALFGAADVVVLPYHRSSVSGPLHLAMAQGLPVVVSAVGGLVEATEGYEGAIQVPPRNPAALRQALDAAYELRGRRFTPVTSWERTLEGYGTLFETLGVGPAGVELGAPAPAVGASRR